VPQLVRVVLQITLIWFAAWCRLSPAAQKTNALKEESQSKTGEFAAEQVAVASHFGPLGLQTLLGVKADRKFPVLIVHGDKDKLLSVEFARENRDKYRKEGHEVKYVEVAGMGHVWATKQKVNDMIWEFFDDHPLNKK